MKSKGTAYLLWIISICRWLGFHHFYLGKIGKGIIWILTLGFFGVGSLVDLKRLNRISSLQKAYKFGTIPNI